MTALVVDGAVRVPAPDGDLLAERRLEIIPGATHLFEEPGALEEVTRRAGDWFVEHVGGA